MSNNRDKELQAELAKEEAEQQLKAAKHVEQTREFLKKQEQAQKMTSEGNYKEARERILEPLLKSLKTNVNFGKQHPFTLNIKFEIGKSFSFEEDYQQAKAVFKDTLKWMEKVNGKKDKQTLEAKFLLASCLDQLDQKKETLAMFMELLPVLQAVLGKNYTLTKMTETEIAKLLILDKQSRDKGLEMLEVMLVRRIKDEGQDGRGAIYVKFMIAYAYQLSHDVDKCLALHKEILASQKKTLGEDHKDTKQTIKHIDNLMNNSPHLITIPAFGKCATKTHILTNEESIQEILDYYKPFLKD